MQFEEIRYIACQNRHICNTLRRALSPESEESGNAHSSLPADLVLDVFNGVWDVIRHQGLPWQYPPDRWEEIREQILHDKAGRSFTEPGAKGEKNLTALLGALEQETDPTARLAWERLAQKVSPKGEENAS